VIPPPNSPTPIERLRQGGIRPDRSLGQNFLIDPNILDVIERTASLAQDDVVLEVGPGLGVLTERLVARCRAVHSVEMDRRLAGLLTDEFGGRPGFQLHQGDAMRVRFDRLQPPPNKFVSNLPYNVAAPLVMKSFAELPSVSLWCLMVQKEIADRLFAAPGSSAYGGVSVMAQLMARKLSARPISAKVFYPQPRVRSSLLAFERSAEGARLSGKSFIALKELVYAAFSHRRKMLVNSLAEADPPPAALMKLGAAESRRLVEAALSEMGLPANLRAQDLTPPQFLHLAKQINRGHPPISLLNP